MTFTACDTIKNAQKEHKLVLFIGAGVSVNSGYPTWNSLIDNMAQQLGITSPSEFSNYLQVIPQIYYTEKGETAYRNFLHGYFEYKKTMDNVILDELMSMNPEHIITTNYDCLIEHAIRKASKTGSCHDYELIACDEHLVKSHKKNYLIKMHGDLDNFDALVLKENDYLNYSSHHILIETFIKSLLVNHVFVFIGYSLQDTTLNMIMSWVDELIKTYHSPSEQLCSHVFFSTEELNSHMLMYYKNKRILAITPSQSPKFRKLPKHKLTDERGICLLKMLRGCIEYQGNDYRIWTKDLIKDILMPFLQFRRLHFEDVKKAMAEVDYHESNWTVSGDTLYINAFYIAQELIDLYQNDKDVYCWCNCILTKSGITNICFEAPHGEEYMVDIPYTQETDPIYQALLSFDFEALSKISFNKNGKLLKNEDALYCAYIMNRKKKIRHKYRRRLMYDAQHSGHYSKRIIYNFNYFTDKLSTDEGYEYKRQLELLPKQYLAPLQTFAEYVKELSGTVSQMQQALLNKLRKATPYSGTVTYHFHMKDTEIGKYRYQVTAIYRYLIENRINVVSFSSCRYNLSGMPELVKTYIEYLLVAQSPALALHEKYQESSKRTSIIWQISDLHLMLMFVNFNDISITFARYNVFEIHGAPDVPEYLVQCLTNICTSLKQEYVSPRLLQDYNELIPKMCFVAQRMIWENDMQLKFVQIARELMFELLARMNNYNMQVSANTYKMLWQLYWEQINEQKIFRKNIGKDFCKMLQLIWTLQGENQSSYLEFVFQRALIYNMASVTRKYKSKYEKKVVDKTLDIFLTDLTPIECRLNYAVQLTPLLNESQNNRIMNFYYERGNNITANEIFDMVYFDLIAWSNDIEYKMKQYCIQYMQAKQHEQKKEAKELRQQGISVSIAPCEWLAVDTIETNPFLMLYNLYVKQKIESLTSFGELLPPMTGEDDINSKWHWLTNPHTFDYHFFDVAWLEDVERLNLMDVLSKSQKSIILDIIEKHLYPGQDRQMFEWYYSWKRK